MALPPIKYLIVLMLENRSFDHMLGFLSGPGYPIDGLTGTEKNVDDDGEPVAVSNDAAYSGDFDPDPGHDFDDVKLQLYGTTNPAPGQEPDMSGFVKDYRVRCNGSIPASHRIMRCFAPDKLPALVTLAKNFAVCTRYFSSIPGPTLPNRLFAHAGSSGGRLDLAPEYFSSGFNTIFNVLDAADVSATIYSDGWTALATVPKLLEDQGQFFAGLDDSTTGFFTACKRAKLSSYCFLEPRYSSRLDNGIILPQNDQHPHGDVREGDNLIRRVYEAIRGKDEIWKHCMFVITWSQHGGTFDHVKPPTATPPGDGNAANPDFDSSRYGVRVPAVVVSPYIKAGKICDTVFDHTSLPATAAELFLKRPLKPAELRNRAAVANSLSECFDPGLVLNGPRKDTVVIPGALLQTPVPTPKPLNALQQDHLNQAIALELKLPKDAGTGIDRRTIRTADQADYYIRQVYQAAMANGIIIRDVPIPTPIAIRSSRPGLRPVSIFLCHASEDKAEVRNLYTKLRRGGFQPWLDEEDLLPGQEWELEISKAVRKADVVIVCLSRQATTKTGYLQKEIKDALDAADLKPEGTLYIIPLKLEDCKVPERLKKWQWVNHYEPNGYEKLRRALELRANSLSNQPQK